MKEQDYGLRLELVTLTASEQAPSPARRAGAVPG